MTGELLILSSTDFLSILGALTVMVVVVSVADWWLGRKRRHGSH